MAYSTRHDMTPCDNAFWAECKRCGKRRHGRYVFEMRWFAAERDGARELQDYPNCVWHDHIVDGKSDLW
jgi:hypothetical protein